MARPRTPKLSVARITDAAITLIDSTGNLNILELAKRLDVAPSSLYNHVDGRSGIIEAIRARLVEEEMANLRLDGNWEENTRSALSALRSGFARHPRAAPLLFQKAITETRTLEAYDAFARSLIDAGFRVSDIVSIISVIDAFALGASVDLIVPDELWQLPPEGPDTPQLGSLRLALEADQHDNREMRAFDLGVEIILAGLGALLRRTREENSPG